MVLDLGGLWAGTSVLLAVIVFLLAFAIYKQHCGTLTMPERVPEGKASSSSNAQTDAAKASPEDPPPPPYPAAGPTGYAYEQTVQDSGDVTVEVHGNKAACTSPTSPHVYEQPVQLETST